MLIVKVGCEILQACLISSEINDKPRRRTAWALVLGVSATLALSACGPAPANQGIQDPHEAQNRKVHAVNKALDKNLLRPLASGATKIVPEPVQQGVVNFAANLELPGSIVNDVLQFRLENAAENTVRFVINSTFGIGGLFDPAKVAGAPGKPTDFGETLHIWGVAEGNYIELPALGPSNDRDAVGKVVDFAMDPLSVILPSPKNVGLFSKLASKIADRGRYSETVDSILYDSADSYAQERLLYTEHRRYNLGEVPPDTAFEDPYAQ